MNEPTGVSLAGLTVVVADDEQFSRTIFAKMLTGLNCGKVIQTVNGVEALEQLQRMKHDGDTILVCDFNMPKLNGLQLLKMIRTGAAGTPHDLDVIMLTGNGSAELVSAAVQLDVDAFLVKPISKNNLASRLMSVLSDKSELKPADHYAAVDIDDISASLKRDPVVKDVQSMPKPPPAAPKGLHTRLELVMPGSSLARDIIGPDGKLVLSAGAVLTDRILQRLEELRDLLDLDSLYVLLPGKK